MGKEKKKKIFTTGVFKALLVFLYLVKYLSWIKIKYNIFLLDSFKSTETPILTAPHEKCSSFQSESGIKCNSFKELL